MLHLQTVNNRHSRIKRFLHRFHGAATKVLIRHSLRFAN